MLLPVFYKDNNYFNFEISFDPFGNLYLDGTKYNLDNYFEPNINLFYQININNKNEPVGETGNYQEITDYDDKMINMRIIDKNLSLKAKIFKDIEKKIEENNDENDFFDEEEIKGTTNYFPEDEDYVIDENLKIKNDKITDEFNIQQYGVHNLKFDFFCISGENILIKTRENGDVMSLYDTYLYDNTLIFKTNSKDDSSIYRFRIFKNGDIFFRAIGEIEKKYKIFISSNGNLSFIC